MKQKLVIILLAPVTQDDDPKVPTMDSVTSYHTQLVILSLDELCQRFSNIAIKEVGGRDDQGQEAPTECSIRCPSCPPFT